MGPCRAVTSATPTPKLTRLWANARCFPNGNRLAIVITFTRRAPALSSVQREAHFSRIKEDGRHEDR
jgi:hypothetical protein